MNELLCELFVIFSLQLRKKLDLMGLDCEAKPGFCSKAAGLFHSGLGPSTLSVRDRALD